MKSFIEALRGWFVFLAAVTVVLALPGTFASVVVVGVAACISRYLYRHGGSPDTLFPKIADDADWWLRHTVGAFCGWYALRCAPDEVRVVDDADPNARLQQARDVSVPEAHRMGLLRVGDVLTGKDADPGDTRRCVIVIGLKPRGCGKDDILLRNVCDGREFTASAGWFKWWTPPQKTT